MIYWGSELTHTSYLFWNYFSDVSVLGKKKESHVCVHSRFNTSVAPHLFHFNVFILRLQSPDMLQHGESE